jgi:hypothetical protein
MGVAHGRNTALRSFGRSRVSWQRLVIFICVLVAAVAMIRKSARVRKFAAAGAALTSIGYVALLFAVALASRDTTLPPGNSKYFCEADCHIAYSIESVTEASTLIPYHVFSSIMKTACGTGKSFSRSAQSRPRTPLQAAKLLLFFVF